MGEVIVFALNIENIDRPSLFLLRNEGKPYLPQWILIIESKESERGLVLLKTRIIGKTVLMCPTIHSFRNTAAVFDRLLVFNLKKNMQFNVLSDWKYHKLCWIWKKVPNSVICNMLGCLGIWCRHIMIMLVPLEQVIY